MKYNSVLFLFFFFSLCCKAQNEAVKDSLWKMWENKKVHDTLRLDALEVFLYEIVFYEPSKALELGHQHLELSKELKDPKRIANANYAIAYTLYEIGDLDKALVHYETSSKLHASIGDISFVMQTKIAQGHIYKAKKQNNEALRLYGEADSLATLENDLDVMIPAKLYTLNISSELGNYKKCLELSVELDALFIHPDLKKSKIFQANLFLAKSLIYTIAGKKKEAITATLKAAKLNEERHYINYAADLYGKAGKAQLVEGDTLGGLTILKYAYGLLDKMESRYNSSAAMYAMSVHSYVNKEYALAIQYLDSGMVSLERRQRNNINSEWYYQKGIIKFQTQRFEEAIINCTKALEETKENGKIELTEKCLRCLYESHLELKDYEKALGYLQKAETIKDSLFSKDQVRDLAIQEANNQFDLERQKTAFMHEAEIKEEYQFRKMLLGVSISLTGFLILSFLTYLSQRKRKVAQNEQKLQENFSQQLLQTTEDERSRIAGDLHDSVSHELLYLKQKIKSGKALVDEELAKVVEKVRGISHNLYPAMFEQIGLEKSIEGLCQKIIENSSLQIAYQSNYDIKLSTKQELQVYRIIEEALNNIIKHSEATHVFIKVNNNQSRLQINIKDNGKGFDVNTINDDKTSFGISNMKQRAKTLKGTLRFNSNSDGVEINLIINT